MNADAGGTKVGRQPGQELHDDEELTQHGKCLASGELKFNRMLRTEKEKPERDMSLIRGRLHPNAAGDVRIGPEGARTESALKRDAARYTTVGNLREKDFLVKHTPRFPGSPLHVSVYWEHGEWDGDIANLFDACFDIGIASHLRDT